MSRVLTPSQLDKLVGRFVRALRAFVQLGERIEKLHAESASPWLDRARVAQRMGMHIKVVDKLKREDPTFPTPSCPLKSPRWRVEEIDAYMESKRGGRG